MTRLLAHLLLHCKKRLWFFVPSWDVTNQTIPGREHLILPGQGELVRYFQSGDGKKEKDILFYSVPSASCLSFCESPSELSDVGGGGGERRTIPNDHEKGWPSINHSIFSALGRSPRAKLHRQSQLEERKMGGCHYCCIRLHVEGEGLKNGFFTMVFIGVRQYAVSSFE